MHSWIIDFREDINADGNLVVENNVHRDSSVILVVNRNGRFADPVMEYILDVAERMNCRLLVAYVDTLPFIRNGGEIARDFLNNISENVRSFKKQAESRSIQLHHVVEAGKVRRVVHRICHIIKRIQFVIVDAGIAGESVVARSPVPVFKIENKKTGQPGLVRVNLEAKRKMLPRKAGGSGFAMVKSIVFGFATLSMYFIFFKNAEMIMNYSSRGGVFFLVPLITVCIFSYALAGFIDNGFSALGLHRLRLFTLKSIITRKNSEIRRRQILFKKT